MELVEDVGRLLQLLYSGWWSLLVLLLCSWPVGLLHPVPRRGVRFPTFFHRHQLLCRAEDWKRPVIWPLQGWGGVVLPKKDLLGVFQALGHVYRPVGWRSWRNGLDGLHGTM